jgi:pyruvate formate lyase activating enzyme
MHADAVERKPLYHVRPGGRVLSLGMAGCNLRCAFCQNWRLSQAPPTPDLPITPPEAVIAAAQTQGCVGVACTYHEPTVGLDYVVAVLAAAKQAALVTVLNTNGYLTPAAIDELAGVLDAANVDLKGFREAFYREVCQAHLAPVCEAIAHLHRRGVWVEVTTPIIPGVNDQDAELGDLAGFVAGLSTDIPWHVWRFHPDYQMPHHPWTPPRDLERAVAIGRGAGLRYVYTSNTPGSPHQHTHCPRCAARLVARVGERVTENHLTGGACPSCGQRIPGWFETTREE